MAQRIPPTKGSGRGSGAGSGSAGSDPGFEPDDDPPGRRSDGAPAKAVKATAAGASSLPVAPPPPAASAPAGRSQPFVWQHDHRWLLLDGEARAWTVAELRFEAESCRYVEVRRARYRWPREAAGALLARLAALGEPPMTQAALALHRWLAEHGGAPDHHPGA